MPFGGGPLTGDGTVVRYFTHDIAVCPANISSLPAIVVTKSSDGLTATLCVFSYTGHPVALQNVPYLGATGVQGGPDGYALGEL